MNRPGEHVDTRLRLSRDTLALIDQTVAKARDEFGDPEIDRQRVLELLIEQRLENLRHDGGMEETRFSLFKVDRSKRGLWRSPSAGRSSITRGFGGWGWRLTRGEREVAKAP